MTMLTAHSGCDHTPDNSLEFVKYVLEKNVDCFEVDIRNKEEKLILSHEEPGENSISLEKVFRLLRKKSNIKINCDLKEKNLEKSVYQLAKLHQVEKQLIFTGSVELENFRKNKNLFPGVTVFYNIENLSPYPEEILRTGVMLREKMMEEIQKIAEELIHYNIAGINMNVLFYSKKVLEILKRYNLKCSLWTVNESQQLIELLSQEIENITTRKWTKAQEIRSKLRNDF